MVCVDCAARRELVRKAWEQAKIKEALGHVAKGVAEIVGLKEKTGKAELEAEPKEALKKPR